jgi:hypothetical protein
MLMPGRDEGEDEHVADNKLTLPQTHVQHPNSRYEQMKML